MKLPILDRLKSRVVDDWRDWWKLWSVRLNALGLAIMGWVAFDPVPILYVWNLLPREVRVLLPAAPLAVIGATLFALSMSAKLVKQRKLEKPRDR